MVVNGEMLGLIVTFFGTQKITELAYFQKKNVLHVLLLVFLQFFAECECFFVVIGCR